MAFVSIYFLFSVYCEQFWYFRTEYCDMDNKSDIFCGNIDELVKASKQLQNKLRKELKRQAESLPAVLCDDNIAYPPVWNRNLLKPYVKNVISGHLTKNLGSQYSLPSSRPQPIPKKLSSTIGTQVSLNELLSGKLIQSKAKVHESVDSKKTTKSLPILGKKKPTVPPLDLRTNKQKQQKPKTKPQAKQIPFQRFIGSSCGPVDFSKDHPHLELDITSKQSTLFPRRFIKGTKNLTPYDINVASAKTTTSSNGNTGTNTSIEVKHNTWNAVLLKNPVIVKPRKIPKLQKSKTIVNSVKGSSPCPDEEPGGPEIISIPTNGLFRLEKQTNRLSKRKKCKSQHFPVMYIRPRERIQHLPNISIHGVDVYATTDGTSQNVKYVECVHDEDKLREEINPVNTALFEPEVEVPEREDNKFFKALEETVKLGEDLPSERCSQSLSDLSKPSGIFSSMPGSSLNLPQSASSPTLTSFDNDIQITIDKILTASAKREHREACVQTDLKSIASTSLDSLVLESELPSPVVHPPNTSQQSVPRPTITQTTYSEEDIIAKIFERIQKDSSVPVQICKAGYHTFGKEDESQKPISMPTQNSIQSADDEQSTTLPTYTQPANDKVRKPKEQLVPPAVPLVTQSKGARLKQVRHNYPTDAEIKRAVKMFLDTLTLQENRCNSVDDKIPTMKSNLRQAPKQFTNYGRNTIPIHRNADTKKQRNVGFFSFKDTSSSSSSISELESDEFDSDVMNSDRDSSNAIAGTHSDGEVLSFGEV